MNRLALVEAGLPAMNGDDIELVSLFERHMLEMPQVDVPVTHHLHAGLYARTICIPAGVVITGALIKIPTLLTFSGCATVFVGGESIDLQGYHVLPAQAGRKQVFQAHTDTNLTMIFATQATTVEEAEVEFTDEADQLASRRPHGHLTQGEN